MDTYYGKGYQGKFVKRRVPRPVPATRMPRRLEGETKYYDQFASATLGTGAAGAWTGTNVDPAAGVNTLFVPILGTDISNRIGRRVLLKSIKANFDVNIPALAGTNLGGRDPAVIRLICFMDMQTNGAQATGDMLMGPIGPSAIAEQHFQNLGNLGRFKILYDKRFTIQDPNIGSTQAADTYDINGIVVSQKMRVKFRKGIIVNFNATNGGTVADIIDNSIHVICCASSIAMGPVLSYTCRTSYKDV